MWLNCSNLFCTNQRVGKSNEDENNNINLVIYICLFLHSIGGSENIILSSEQCL